jgi:mono/diheme cytochrome c family protein
MRALRGALFVVAVACSAVAEEPASAAKEMGSSIYRLYCSSCHGSEGKGDGPIADGLRIRPPDLTLLAARSNGSFAAEEVFRIIDGRKPVKNHGGADMPVWGDAFKSSREGYSEQAVKQKLESLVEFLESIQAKKAK